MSIAVIWIVNLLGELQVPQTKFVTFFCDSAVFIHIDNNPVFHERKKHVESDCHQVSDRIVSGLIKTLYVGTDTQIADVLSEIMYPTQFNSLISKMLLRSIYSPS